MTKTITALIVQNGNETFRIPLNKSPKEISAAIMACIDEITGYNADYFKVVEIT